MIAVGVHPVAHLGVVSSTAGVVRPKVVEVVPTAESQVGGGNAAQLLCSPRLEDEGDLLGGGSAGGRRCEELRVEDVLVNEGRYQLRTLVVDAELG